MALGTPTTTLNVRSTLVAAALALALVAGIAGGVVGAIVNGLIEPAAPTADGPRVVVLDPKWVDYGNAWEQRYRQMYPDSAG